MTVHRSALATNAQASYNYLESINLDANRLFKNAGLDPEKTDSTLIEAFMGVLLRFFAPRMC